MSDSDDDLPPPLEDMSETIQANQQKKAKLTAAAVSQENEGEEIRLKPKATPTTSVIKPTEETVQPAAQAKPVEQKKKQSSGFGGLAGGFFNNPPAKKKPASKPLIEDVTHIKAQPKQERMKIDEVQSAMTADQIEKTKDQWMTPELLQKIMSKPHMMEILSHPQFSDVLKDMQKDPKVAMQKYGANVKLREFMMEFSSMMGSHFESVADQEKRNAEAKAKQAEEDRKRQEEERMKDPVYRMMQTDPQVKACLEDPKVQKVIQTIQTRGGLDFNEVARSDPQTAQKMMFLINKGVLNTQSQAP